MGSNLSPLLADRTNYVTNKNKFRNSHTIYFILTSTFTNNTNLHIIDSILHTRSIYNKASTQVHRMIIDGLMGLCVADSPKEMIIKWITAITEF